jgi:transaldolase
MASGTKNPLFSLAQLGQSVWCDEFARPMITRDELRGLIEERAVVGVTTNPSIFGRAIGETADYDGDLRRLAQGGASPEEALYELAIHDVSTALDVLAEVYQRSDHIDGRVSHEVPASLAYDTEATMAAVRDASVRINKPNLYVKIPATEQGIPAIEQMLYEGQDINITLIFGLDYYRRVAGAYLNALERRAAEGNPIDDIHSVASFFVSRVDTKVDNLLDGLVQRGKLSANEANRLHGRAAVANAKLAYQAYKEIFGSDRFKKLEALGARPQRCLWASTSTKNPSYPELLYVDSLIGPETVNTMPLKTLEGYADHGDPAPRLEEQLDQARELFGQLEEVGIDIKQVTNELIAEGVEAFAKAHDKLIESISSKSAVVARR